MTDETSAAATPAPSGKEMTGRKVLFIFVGFFGVVFAVNFYMAHMAISTFPGLDVDVRAHNGYVASQNFDAERAAQIALGWNVTAALEGSDTLKVDILGKSGTPAEVATLSGRIGRATEAGFDQDLTFSTTSTGSHVAKFNTLGPGRWEVRLYATAPDGTYFHQRLILNNAEN